jgi:hypothetical protein
LWQNLAIVAAEHPPLARDIVEKAEADAELRRTASFLALIGRLEPRSERLLQACLAALAGNSGSYNWFDSTEAAAILLADHFRGDPKVEERLVALNPPHRVRTGSVMALCLGWGCNRLLQELEFDTISSLAMDAGELYAKYVCLPASNLAAALETDLVSAQRNPFHVDNVIRPLIARLHTDSEAVSNLSDALFSTVNPSVKATFPKILAASGSFTAERDKWCRDELARQRALQSPEIGYDLLAKVPRAVSLCLLDSLGETSPVEQSFVD